MVKPQSGWSSIVLVALMLLTVAWSIEVVGWVPGLGILTPAVLAGVVVGLVLGSQVWLPASLAHGWSIVLGLVTSTFLTSMTLAEFVPARSLESLSRLERMGLVRDWFLGWLADALQVGAVRNDMANLVFVLEMTMLLWLIAYICTWFVVRYLSWWGAVLPSGFALVLNLYYAPQKYLAYLALFLLCALILAVQTHLALQLERWRRDHIGFSADIGFGFLRDGLLVAVVVIALGWITPTGLGSGRFRDLLYRLTGSTRGAQEQFNRLFPSLNYPVRGGGTAFGPNMPLGGSISLGKSVIFDAQVDATGPTPRYWRLAAFDTYDGTGWSRHAERSVAGDPLQMLADPYVQTVPVTQTIRTFQKDTRQLFAAPQPNQFSVPVTAESGGGPNAEDVLTVDSVAPIAQGESYQAISRATIADVESLRTVAEADPDWVQARYLELPPSVPQRVLDLAAEVTAETTNRFDGASAIETYLRGAIAYSETISDPPTGRDRVDWVLFDEKRGYCDYYSSSFVVLARAVGIPARMAAGYSQGEYVTESGVWRQRESDAHTWAEVFFPGYGWVEFEPTAGESLIARPSSPAESDALAEAEADPPPLERDEVLPEEDQAEARDPLDPGADEGGGGRTTDPRALWLLGIVGLVAGMAGLGFVVWDRPLRGLSPAEGAFARFVRVGSWLGLRPGAGDTPFEYGERVAGIIPERESEIATITDAYVRERFGRRASEGHGERLMQSWQALRRPLLRAAARLGFHRLRRRR